MQMAKTRVTEHNMVMDENKTELGTQRSEIVHGWRPPAEGILKANWDAAINGKGGKMGMGVVIRNNNGKFCAAKSSFINGCFDPTVAEALAATHAINFCKELGIQRLQLEGDAKNVVNAIISREENWSRMGHIIDDAKKLLEGFQHWEINFVGRNANFAAHIIAIQAAQISVAREWLGEIPDCILEVIQREQSVT
jgi:ribonuclease HI